MTALLLAWTLALPAGASPQAKPSPYGILLLADRAGGSWRKELALLRGRIKNRAVESAEVVDASSGGAGVQRALDRLLAQHVGKVVAVPLMTMSESPGLEHIRYLFGLREEPSWDRPDHDRGLPTPRAAGRSALVLPPDERRPKRLQSPVPLALAPTIDRSPLLAAILADRAKTLARDPARETVVLVGLGPRSDAALAAWKASAAVLAERVRVKGGFRKAAVVAVRGNVRAGQRDKDRTELRKIFRGLAAEGHVAAVPLASDGSLVERLLKRDLGNAAYRWDGRGTLGDGRLIEWIQSAAETTSRGEKQ